MLKVQAAVKEVFGSLSLREDISMERFSELTLEVRKKVEGATEDDRTAHKWLSHLIPPRDQEEFVLKESGMTVESSLPLSSGVDSPLRRLLNETSDLIESPSFSHVLTLLLDAGFSMLVDQKLSQQAFKIPPTSDIADLNAPRIQEIVDVAPVKLPIVLATLTRQAHSIGNGVPNEYLQAMEQVRDLEAFAAVVYSSNWEAEVMPMTEDMSTRSKKTSDDDTMIFGTESTVDVGSSSGFEAAWGKAVGVIDQVGGKAADVLDKVGAKAGV